MSDTAGPLNSTSSFPVILSNNNDGNRVGSLGYCIGVSIGITLVIAVISLVSYYFTRSHRPFSAGSSNSSVRADAISWILNSRSIRPDGLNHVVLSVNEGLDDATISGFPKLLYSDVKRVRGMEESTAASCCSVCLADYKGNDGLRLLPDCGHLFHDKCIDPWLRSHPTCPVCRTSPVPTPLAEAVVTPGTS
ncbi:hypothetical protein MLD38_015987 [Melastoma candidum]|uniref:Uncharacterized protein n=1 Tax=Melastoma candidum TaxID=119954 RepID=A0ACB9RI37_9MYRT|nr:hypothetical protein MLD38_015987 [Melastoma candidum]